VTRCAPAISGLPAAGEKEVRARSRRETCIRVGGVLVPSGVDGSCIAPTIRFDPLERTNELFRSRPEQQWIGVQPAHTHLVPSITGLKVARAVLGDRLLADR
jgi:hypothetical protein